ncbi:MAG: T9SS type A sorting domain-containing protein [Bacteroidetes bacterium]|nr:T9SS type A sorting domain-containing protein [Bacteroidota bacterium]
MIAAASFDPNHKSAIPAGETDLGYVDPATSHLEYKIEFQNLGNDSATFIVVYDTLSSEILFESFHMLSASHNYTLDFNYPNIVKWTFNNINLPYSFIDEPGSQGFVKFEVDLQPGLPVGTQIKNNAAIYFDYNPAVITNTAYTTLQLYIPDFIADDQLFQKVIVYPNPSDNQISFSNLPDGEFIVDIYDLNGVLMQTSNINSSQQYVAVHSLPPGQFIFQIKSNHNLVGSGKLIIIK